jgi:hypothetical protein
MDKHGLMLVNFKNLIHRGDQITDEPYVLTSKSSKFSMSKMEGTPIGLAP